jgi:hypothetical protein
VKSSGACRPSAPPVKSARPSSPPRGIFPKRAVLFGITTNGTPTGVNCSKGIGL